MGILESPESSFSHLDMPISTLSTPELPSQLKKGVREGISMDLDALRASLIPTDEMARKIEESSDPVGGIHGLKLILSKTGHYKGRIDGAVDTTNANQKKGKETRVNPIVKGLIDFQFGYNSPYQLSNDGKLVYKSQTDADFKQGIPRDEFGKLGPVTLTALLDFAKRNGIELPPGRGDKKFESGSEFLQKYGPMVDYLTSTLSLPKNLILGIAKQESSLGTNPGDYWGGNGVLQLTSAPMADMSGITQKPGVTDWRKVGIYQKLYQKIEPETLKGLPFGSMMRTLESSLDDEAWDVVETVCGDDTEPKDFRDAMLKIKSWERGKFRGLTFHTLNILVGSVYLAYINDYRLKGAGNVAQIAKYYNGSEQKDRYAESVTRHVASFGISGRPQSVAQGGSVKPGNKVT